MKGKLEMSKFTSYIAKMTKAEIAEMQLLADDYGMALEELMAFEYEDESLLIQQRAFELESKMRDARGFAKNVANHARIRTADKMPALLKSDAYAIASELVSEYGTEFDVIATISQGKKLVTLSVHEYVIDDETGKRVHAEKVIGTVSRVNGNYGFMRAGKKVRVEFDLFGMGVEIASLSSMRYDVTYSGAKGPEIAAGSHTMKAAKRAGHSDITGERASKGSEMGEERTSIARPSGQGRRDVTEEEKRASTAARVRRWREKKAAELGKLQAAQTNIYRTADYLPNLRKGPKPSAK